MSSVYFATGSIQAPTYLAPRQRIETLDGQTGVRFKPILIGFALTQIPSGTAADSDAFYSIGFATAGKQYQLGMWSDNGVNPATVWRYGTTGSVSSGVDNDRVVGEVSVHQFNQDGFTLQWLTPPDAASYFKDALLVWWAIGGDGVDNVTLSLQTQPSAAGSVLYDLGYSPDALILVGKTGVWNQSRARASIAHSLGFVAGGAQAYSASFHTDNTTSDTSRRQIGTACIGWPTATGIGPEAAWVRNEKTGYVLNWTGSPDGATQFLTIAIRGPKSALVTSNGLTSNGSRTVTAGFAPVGFLLSNVAGAASASTVASAIRSYGACASTAMQWAMGYYEIDAANPSQAAHFTRTDVVSWMLAGTQPTTAIASFTSTGITVTDAATDATAREQLFLFFGNPSTATPPTNFTSFRDSAQKEVIVLAEVDPSLKTYGWVVDGTYTNCYKYTVANFAHSSYVKGGLYRRVVGVRIDQTDYTEVASAALANATPRSWYWDESTGIVYVYTSSGADPDTFTVVQVFVRLYFATQAIVLNRTDGSSNTGIYYHPRLTSTLPEVASVVENMMFGGKEIPSGSLGLTNGDGLWNDLIQTYQWRNKAIRFYVGGSWPGGTLLRSEYQTFTSMLVRDITCDENGAQLTLSPMQRMTDVELPPTPLFESTYPRLGEGVRGTRKWVGWGRAIIAPDLVDTSGNGTWCFMDSAYMQASAVHNVWIVSDRGGDSVTRALLPSASYTVDLVNGTLSLVSTSGIVPTDYSLEVELSGPVDDDGQVIKTAGAVAKDMLKRFAGLKEKDFLSGQFRACDEEWDAEISVWLKSPRSLASILATSEADQPSIERSSFLRVIQGLDGLWTATLYDPSRRNVSGFMSLRKEDLSSWSPQLRVSEAICGARVHYAQNLSTGEWSVKEVTSTEQQYLQQTTDKIDVHTFLTDSWRAEVIGKRAAAIVYMGPLVFAFSERGMKLAQMQAGDKVLVTFSPAPVPNGAMTNQLLEISKLTKTSLLGISGEFFLSGFGDRVGVVAPTADTALAYTSGSADQQKNYAWVADSNGDVVTGDPTTHEISIIF